MTEPDPAPLPPFQDEEPVPIEQEQLIRKRRLGMGTVSYCATLLLVMFFAHKGMISVGVVIGFALTAVTINALFFLLIHTNRNLKMRDPTLAAPQIVCSIIPTLLVLHFLEDGQARGIMLMLAVVAVSFGVMTLETKALLRALLIMFGGYLASLWLGHEVLATVRIGSLEALQMAAVLIVSAQVIWLGTHINRLRDDVIERNRTLSATMTELHTALETIQALATRDELTGLYNRRHLYAALEQEVARQKRDGRPFSVCMLDIDHFKRINDEYGHEGGDKVLRALADSVQSSLRGTDCFGRMGGEEFLLILPGTTLADAEIKAERVRQLVEAMTVPALVGAWRTTVSIGVAEFGEEAIDETVRRADASLYLAKNAGRNRVVARPRSVSLQG